MFQPLYHSRRIRRFIAQEICENAWRTSNMARSRLELAMLGDMGSDPARVRRQDALRRFTSAEHRARRRWARSQRARFPAEEDPDVQDGDWDHDLDAEIVENAPDLVQLSAIPHDLQDRWLRLRKYLATQPPARIWAVLKALAGAWTTADRMHVNPQTRQCILGCDKPDSIQHYMQCPRMLHHLAAPRGILSTDVLTRMGLPTITTSYEGENGIKSSAMRMAVSTKIYHMMKDNIDSDPKKYYDATNAARHALRLPSDLSGGAGRSAAPHRG